MARPITTPDAALVAAVANSPGATAAEVAGALGIGQSTAQKRLAALEAQGAVRRIPGGRVDGARAPDRWHPAATEGVASATAEAPVGEEAAEKAGADEKRPVGERSGRLGRGALAAMVRDYLAARPTEAFGPAALGKALGRSQGAVSNALAAMAERNEAVLVAERPRRYRIG